MAIQQHPVPQDISNYKFRLIGDMTIKQFAALGISIVLAVIIYSSPMPFFFKYPLSFFLLLLGVGTAFVPFQGRTLDVWIIAFIKSIYSPTQYIWKHGQNTPLAAPDTSANPQTPVVPISAPASDASQTSPTENISLVQETETQTMSENTSPLEQTSNQDAPTVPQNTPTTPTSNPAVPEPQPTQTPTPEVDNEVKPLLQENNTTVEPEITNSSTNTQENITTNSQSTVNDLQAISSLPIPFTPTTPNTLVGLTLNPQGQTLDGVLVEIKNQSVTVRATKSNKLGQFLFVRPLENGLYQIIAEKDGFTFENYSIELNGEIINPLRIQAVP